jgi:hypothetical protein
MQNRYVGDVGDFGKYALLKKLADHDLRLGIAWYLNLLEEGNQDGNLRSYLDSKRKGTFQQCDPTLHDSLRSLRNRRPCLSLIQENAILPEGTAFYDTELWSEDHLKLAYGQRETNRKQWFVSAFDKLRSCDIVFFDPDNGLETKTTTPRRKSAAKYVFLSEVSPFVENGQSIIIYQHQSRAGTLKHQINARRSQLTELNGVRRVWAVVFPAGQVRIFFIIPSRKHESTFKNRLHCLSAGPCNTLFKLYLE